MAARFVTSVRTSVGLSLLLLLTLWGGAALALPAEACDCGDGGNGGESTPSSVNWAETGPLSQAHPFTSKSFWISGPSNLSLEAYSTFGMADGTEKGILL